MMTLDALVAVGGPACHNKGLLHPMSIAIGIPYTGLQFPVSDNGDQPGNCPIKLSKLYKVITSRAKSGDAKDRFPLYTDK